MSQLVHHTYPAFVIIVMEVMSQLTISETKHKEINMQRAQLYGIVGISLSSSTVLLAHSQMFAEVSTGVNAQKDQMIEAWLLLSHLAWV